MITFNNIVERFEIFAENHFFIKSFSFGSPDDVDLSKFEEFPLMHLVYTGATYDAGTKTYNLEVYILDVPHDKKGKVIPQKEAISDSEQCAEDILADIRMGGNIFTFAQDYEVVNATTTPLEEETKNVLSGVLLDLSVAIPYEWDACNAPIDGVAPGGGTAPSFARRGFLRMLEIDGTPDILSVRTIKVTNGTLTDDGDGVVTLDTGGGGAEKLEDLTDVNIIGDPDQGDVISYNTGTNQWMRNGGLQQLLARFKASGTGAQMYDTLNDTTKGYVDILANSATMKVNNSGMTITEASPGVLSLSVAAGTSGNEVEFEAFVITGSDAATNAADVVFKYGSKTYWEVAGGKKIFLRALNTEEITVVLPSSGGQLALTTQIPNVPVDSVNGQTGVVVLDTGDIDENGNLYYTEARVAANSAVAANTAKVGITTQQAADITANNAKIALVVDDPSPQLGGNLDVQAREIDTSTTNGNIVLSPNGTGVLEVKGDTNSAAIQLNCEINTHGVKIQSPPHSEGATYTLTLPNNTGTNGQALTTNGSGVLSFSDVAAGTKYHDRFQSNAQTFRSGATATVELYYTAKADGDGLAESASSDTPTAGKIIRRKIYYSDAGFADPDTGTWVEFTPAPADDASFATVKAALLEYLKARTGGTVPISLKQTWEEIPEATDLLDTYTGAAAGYSLRRLKTGATNAIRVRRSSDNTEQDIGFVDGELDTVSLLAFAGTGDAFVKVWYDQSGNSNDATQTTTANQPKIVSSGAVIVENGKPIIELVQGNSSTLLLNSAITSATSHLFGVGKVGNSGQKIFIGISAGNGYFFSYINRSGGGGVGTDLHINGAASSITTQGQVYSQFVNQTLFNTKYDLSGATQTRIGMQNGGGDSYKMYNTQEFIIYTSAQSASNRAGIETNVNTFYSIF